MISQSPIHRAIVILLTYLGFFAVAALMVFALESSLVLIVCTFIIAYILKPLINYIETKFKHLKRSVISIIISIVTFIFIWVIPAIVIPFLIDQIKILAAHLPQLSQKINDFLLPLNARLHTNLAFNLDWLQKTVLPKIIKNGQSNFYDVFVPVAKNSLTAINGILYLILLPLLLFYIVRDWEKIVGFFTKIIPLRYKTSVIDTFKEIDKSLSYYLRGQIMAMTVMAVIYAILLNIVGIPAATIIGVITGILVFIPYLGFFVGVFLAIIFSLSNFEGIWQIVAVLIVMGVGNLIENFIATPFLIGDSIGLNPILIVFALIVCGNLFGLIGVIASLPLTAIGVVLTKRLYGYYLQTGYYKSKN